MPQGNTALTQSRDGFFPLLFFLIYLQTYKSIVTTNLVFKKRVIGGFFSILKHHPEHHTKALIYQRSASLTGFLVVHETFLMFAMTFDILILFPLWEFRP